MKIIIAFLAALLILSGCSKTQNTVNNDSSPTIAAPSEATDIANPTLESVNDSAEQQERIGNYQLDAVPTKEAATDVATAIFEHMKKTESQCKYTVCSVLFRDDLDIEVWVVVFSCGNADEVLSGKADYCNIGIQKHDGAVYSITFVNKTGDGVPLPLDP